MARIFTEHVAWGNNNGLSGLNGFTCCVIIGLNGCQHAAPPLKAPKIRLIRLICC